MALRPGSFQVQFILSSHEQNTKIQTALAFEIINTSKDLYFPLKQTEVFKKIFSLKQIDFLK